nr:Chain C, Fanconi anemia-associated protein of 20 kDa [Homo sapiens]3WWQ_F Chain F, Fanconi anemia-associated protein of 20 kDa [Homo sapiens]3WWQ_I Chain I, Fanconi anemia-associated protein of 20 kDa [Homo sapiens]3WWQ_L Chain L, Fanconi anemia-associated protein of 20 kDa [Homo sapiens]
GPGHMAALRSCPMCQKEFAPRLTQLDVDSHLAQCLAESTEDVTW